MGGLARRFSKTSKEELRWVRGAATTSVDPPPLHYPHPTSTSHDPTPNTQHSTPNATSSDQPVEGVMRRLQRTCERISGGPRRSAACGSRWD